MLQTMLAALAVVISAHAEAQPLPTITAIDFALDWRSYIGKRVTITGGKFSSSDVDTAYLRLPGSSATVHLKGVQRHILKFLIEDCPLFHNNVACTLPVTGLVVRPRFGDKPELEAVSILMPPRE